MCSLFQVSSFRSCNNPGKISIKTWKDPYVFLKVTWEDPELSCERILEITYFSHQELSRSCGDYIALQWKTQEDHDVILLSILSGSWGLPSYTFLPGIWDLLIRILIRMEWRAAYLQRNILFRILSGSRKLPSYTLFPGILHFLRKKEQFLAGSFPDPSLNLKGNHADLY